MALRFFSAYKSTKVFCNQQNRLAVVNPPVDFGEAVVSLYYYLAATNDVEALLRGSRGETAAL